MVFVMPIALAFQPIIARLAEARDFDRLRSLYQSAARLATGAGSSTAHIDGYLREPTSRRCLRTSIQVRRARFDTARRRSVGERCRRPGRHGGHYGGPRNLTLRFNVIALIADVTFNLALIPLFGMSGAGAAWCVSLLLLCGLRFRQCRDELGVEIVDTWLQRAVLGIVIGACASGLVVYKFSYSSPAVVTVAGFAVGGAAMFGAMWLLGLRIRDVVPTLNMGRKAGRAVRQS